MMGLLIMEGNPPQLPSPVWCPIVAILSLMFMIDVTVEILVLVIGVSMYVSSIFLSEILPQHQ